MSETYAAVDASGDPASAVSWQERLAEWPAVAAYKARSRELLGRRGPFLDVGCGPGTDVVALAPDGVGVDVSAAMCAAAARRGARVCRGEATALPFASGAFGGVRGDRVVQHLAEPDAALEEMKRVTRPGGRVVVSDPDQESLVIHVPGVRQRVLDRVKALRRDLGYRNGRLASRLPELFSGLGLYDVSVEAFALALTDPADAFGLPTWPRAWRDEGPFSDDELGEWESAIQGRPNGFVYCVTYLVVAGTKP